MARDITVTFEDGTTHVYRGAPDNVTPDKVTQRAAQEFGKSVKSLDGGRKAYTAGQMFKDELITSLPGGVVRGVKDIIDTGAGMLSRLGGADEAARIKAMNEAGKAEFEAAKARTGNRIASEVGRVVGNVAATMPATAALGAAVAPALPRLGAAISSGGFVTGAAPVGMAAKAADLGIRTTGGAIAGGVGAGMVNPDDAAQGAAVGAALPAGAKVLGAVGSAIGRAVRPNINNPELARKAISEYGIPLGPADISASQMTKGLRSVLNDAPFTHGIGARQGEAVQEGFNRAIGKTFGADSTKLTPEIMDQARQRMGAEFNRLWNRNSLVVDVDFAKGMAALRDEAKQLPQGESTRLMSWLEDIASKAVDDGAGNFVIPGDVANRLQTKLREHAEKATGFLKSDLETLRRELLGAFNRSVGPEDAAALSRTMKQYKAYKTVEPLLQKAEAGVAGRDKGDIPAALLPEAVRQSYRSGIGSSPFADLTQIGSQYVADRVARTGGSARAWIQNGAIGSALGMGAFTNPLAAGAVIPAALATQKALGSPTLANALANARPNALLLPPELQALIYRATPVIASDR